MANTLNEMIIEYNRRASAAGLPELKSFKDSKAKLQARIDKLPEPPTAAGTLIDFMKLNGINPKVGRAKLRRAGYSAPYAWPSKAITALLIGE